MNGKKMIAVLAAVMLTAVMAGPALAGTISPNPGKIDIEDLSGRFITTNIEYKGDHQATLTLLENEQFDAEAVKAVQEGDVIRSGGGDIKVETLKWDGPDLRVNEGMPEEALFCDAGRGVFERVMENDMVPQLTIGTMDWEIPEWVVMLDWVDPESGEILDDVATGTGGQMTALLQRGTGPSFAGENVSILYDQNNVPQLVWRYYSPAQ